jgi:hypothetical protein
MVKQEESKSLFASTSPLWRYVETRSILRFVASRTIPAVRNVPRFKGSTFISLAKWVDQPLQDHSNNKKWWFNHHKLATPITCTSHLVLPPSNITFWVVNFNYKLGLVVHDAADLKWESLKPCTQITEASFSVADSFSLIFRRFELIKMVDIWPTEALAS